MIDKYIVGTFFASLFAFTFLYILRQNNKNKKKIKDKTTFKAQNNTILGRHDFNGECSPEKIGSGSDIIIVGAGVAGAALAYTLGKVCTIHTCSLFRP